jgi:uncharacterized protein YukE
MSSPPSKRRRLANQFAPRHRPNTVQEGAVSVVTNAQGRVMATLAPGGGGNVVYARGTSPPRPSMFQRATNAVVKTAAGLNRRNRVQNARYRGARANAMAVPPTVTRHLSRLRGDIQRNQNQLQKLNELNARKQRVFARRQKRSYNEMQKIMNNETKRIQELAAVNAARAFKRQYDGGEILRRTVANGARKTKSKGAKRR